MLKRIFYFLIVNIAVLAVLNIVLSLAVAFKIVPENYMESSLDLLFFAAVFGFTGSIVSLFMSKWLVKRNYNVEILDANNSFSHETTSWYFQTTTKIAKKAGIKDIEIGIYDGEPNAFATGWSKNNSLIAVSTGLIGNCTRDEVEAVIGHEIAHVVNGDMVTLTLIQGVVNTFVIFSARVIGGIIDRGVFKNDRGNGVGYYITVFVLEMVLGILASMVVAYFSRVREYAADKGSGELTSYQKMISALERLQSLKEHTKPLQGNMAAFGILGVFSTHPPLEKRIEALKKLKHLN
jgi:heat shock protein HtpX